MPRKRTCDTSGGSRNDNHRKSRRTCAGVLAQKHIDTIVCVLVLSAILIAAIVISYYSYRQQKKTEEENFEQEFENAARVLIARFVASMQQAANTAELVAAAFAHSELTGVAFSKLVSPSIETGAIHGAIRGMSYCPLVQNADRKSFEDAALQTDFGPGLPRGVTVPVNLRSGIWYTDSSGNVAPAPNDTQYVPIFLVYPLAPNQGAIGFDNYISASRRMAIDKVLATGSAATTDIIQLVQDVDDRPSCLVMNPVYKVNSTKLEDIKGFIVSVVNLDGFFEGVLPEFVLDIDMVLKTSLGTAYTLHLKGDKVDFQQHGEFLDDDCDECAQHVRTGSIVLDLNWTIAVYPSQELLDHYLTDTPTYRVLLIAGVFTILAVLVLSYFIVSRRYRVDITKKFERKRQEVLNFSEIVRSLKIHGVRREPRNFPKESLTLDTDDDAVLGEGSFGCVSKGTLNHEEYREVRVAVKQLLEASSFDQEKDLASEAALMCQFAHRNVVELIGVVIKNNSLLMVLCCGQPVCGGCVKPLHASCVPLIIHCLDTCTMWAAGDSGACTHDDGFCCQLKIVQNTWMDTEYGVQRARLFRQRLLPTQLPCCQHLYTYNMPLLCPSTKVRIDR
eukprot:m.296266 g.296266  ORF g.296266 m.296266 type:complete len:617 (+) comp20055_c0_seq4:469-2319(+)